MIALLDVNVLIALLDGDHEHHALCHDWLGNHRKAGWATSPTTQNACLRILTLSAYPRRLSVADVARRLRGATSAPDHAFWSEGLTLADGEIFDHSVMLSSRNLTDNYLLGLAVSRSGRLVTLDRAVQLHAVRGARAENLLVLGKGTGA